MSMPSEPSRRSDGRHKRFGARGPQMSPCCEGPGLFCEEAWAGITERLELSPRQAQIAKAVLADQSDDEIAQALGLSPDTAHSHVQRLREKLHAHSRLQLATRVFATYLAWRTDSGPPIGCPCPGDLNRFQDVM
jgi:DNA-binding CsgD family transcriptional regulator